MASSGGIEEEEKTLDVAQDENCHDRTNAKKKLKVELGNGFGAAADDGEEEAQRMDVGGGNTRDDEKNGAGECKNDGNDDGSHDGHDQTNAKKKLKVELGNGGSAAADDNEEEAQLMDVVGGNTRDDEKKGAREYKEDGNDEDESHDDEDDDDDSDGSPRPMSKRAIKQAIKHRLWKVKQKKMKTANKKKKHEETNRKRKEWDEKLASMTEEERAEAKEEKLRARQERKDEQKQRKERLREAMNSGQNYVIDLEFCDLMKPQELTSLIQQVMYSYAANSKAAHPGRLSLTGVNGQIKKALEKISGYSNWLLHREEQSYMEVFKDRIGDLVYLTADSETILEDIDESKIYIIGGLVDRNRHKNITLEKAQKQGIATAKIPVGDHLKMATSQVLTVNQVMELMLGFRRLKDWKETLNQVVPLRKRAAKGKVGKDGEEESASD